MRLALRLIAIGLLLPSMVTAFAQIALPTFTRTYTDAGQDYSYTVIGSDPAKGGTTTIPTVLVPITLTIEAPMNAAGKKAVLDASPDVANVMRSPIFAIYPFPSGHNPVHRCLDARRFLPGGGEGLAYPPGQA